MLIPCRETVVFSSIQAKNTSVAYWEEDMSLPGSLVYDLPWESEPRDDFRATKPYWEMPQNGPLPLGAPEKQFLTCFSQDLSENNTLY